MPGLSLLRCILYYARRGWVIKMQSKKGRTERGMTKPLFHAGLLLDA